MSKETRTMSTQHSGQFTTISLDTGVKSRLEELKPYDSMSWTEFVEELADTYEDTQ